jgi:hypothetical protein
LIRRILAVALLALGFVAVGGSPATAAEPDTIYSLTNDARWANGQAGLVRNAALDAVAQGWADQLAASGTLSHNPNTGGQIPGGWSSWGENVAQGYPDGASMHAGWMNSPGHRANILGNFTDIGIAFVVGGGTTWGVEVFATYAGSGGAAPPAPPPAPAEPEPAPAEPAPAATPTATPTPSPTPTRSARSSPTPTASGIPAEPAWAVDPVPFVLSGVGVLVVGGGLVLWRVLAARPPRTHGKHRLPVT